MKLHSKLFLSLIAFVTILTAGAFSAHADSVDAATKDHPTYSSIYKVAKRNLGKPYVWGATGASAFDCSGFTSYVYKQATGINITRTAASQYYNAKKVSYRNAKKGDLVFFGWGGSISHVGLYVGNGKMIDAQNRGVVTEKVLAPWWHYYGTARITDLQY